MLVKLRNNITSESLRIFNDECSAILGPEEKGIRTRQINGLAIRGVKPGDTKKKTPRHMRCTLHRENQSDVTSLKSKCQACFEPELVKRLVFWAMAALVRFSELTMLRFQDCSCQSCDKSSARRKENTRVSKNEK